jgi:hypothetical protein
MVNDTMNDITLNDVFSRVAEATGLYSLLPRDQLQQGLVELEVQMLRLASDVLAAEQTGVPLHVAANDWENFPNLNKFHVALRDMLTMELPPKLLAWARELFNKPEVVGGDELQLGLGQIAASPSHPPIHRALARLILFEAVRCSMLMLDAVPQASANVLPEVAGRDASEAFGLDGVMFDFESAKTSQQRVDEVADEQVSWWVAQAAAFDGECRPVTTMLAAALLRVMEHAKRLTSLLSRFDGEVVEELKRRDELERVLKRMNSPDAVLVRNWLGPTVLGEQRLSVEALRARHEVLRGQTRNALDQRMDRLKRRMSEGEIPERKQPSLVDLIAEQASKELP